MSADLIDRLQNPNFDDLQWPKGLFAECADRIEALEAALRNIVGALEDPTGGQHVFDMQFASSIARAALAGEKKDE